MEFSLLNDGTPTYKLHYKKQEVIKSSKLGFELKNDSKQMLSGFSIIDTSTASIDENWEPVWARKELFRIIIMNCR